MKKELNKLIKEFDIQSIEKALIRSYVCKNSLTVSKNKLLKDVLEEEDRAISEIEELIVNVSSLSDMDSMINAFELLIPQSDKKLNGAFFTPSYVSNFIATELINSENYTVCDPSCGCGAFLISAVRVMTKKSQKSVVDIIENNIYGSDVAEYSIRRAKLLLSLLAVENGEDVKEIKFNLVSNDSLKSDWSKLFPKVVLKGGFDVVVGNPPYVKFQDLKENQRADLNRNWRTLKRGTYNLYFAFFELGLNLLHENGSLGYITPNNYFTSLAGVDLRRHLSENRFITKIIDFNHLKIFDAQTYTAITFLDKKGKDHFEFDRFDEKKDLELLGMREYSLVNFSDLNNDKWRLLKNIDQTNIKKIETAGRPLGEIADIRVGIATCLDTAYFVDGRTEKNKYLSKNYNGREYKIEKSATRPIAKISDFNDQADLELNTRRIIFPYRSNMNGKPEIIPEEDVKSLFPHTHRYLLEVKKDLSTRDKGKVDYPEWFAYARTQGLNFVGKKLLTPTFSSKPRFLLENNSDSLFCNGYAIFMNKNKDIWGSDELTLHILQKILNSIVMDYYIKKTSVSIQGGYPCYQKNFIERFTIPKLLKEDLSFLRKTNDKKKIDSYLINKYNLGGELTVSQSIQVKSFSVNRK
jgi:tRNA1(Val) A37 N6-methylase TrmN6